MSCGVGCRCGLDLALLWHRPATAVNIRPLAWEPPYAAGVDLKRQNKNKTKWNMAAWWFASVIILFFFSFFFFFFLGQNLWHMEVPRLGVKSELQLLAHATATAMPDLSNVYNLHHSLWQCWILKPMIEARNWTASSWILVIFLTCWATTGTPAIILFFCWGWGSAPAAYGGSQARGRIRGGAAG